MAMRNKIKSMGIPPANESKAGGARGCLLGRLGGGRLTRRQATPRQSHDAHSTNAREIDWPRVADSMHANGLRPRPRRAHPGSLPAPDRRLRQPEVFTGRRSPWSGIAIGLGEYKYFAYPLPGKFSRRFARRVYPQLAPIANQWMEWLGLEKRFPGAFHRLADAVSSSRAGQADRADPALWRGRA